MIDYRSLIGKKGLPKDELTTEYKLKYACFTEVMLSFIDFLSYPCVDGTHVWIYGTVYYSDVICCSSR